MVNIRVLLDTKFTKGCLSIVAIVFIVILMLKPSIRAFLRSPASSVAILGQILPIRTNFENFDEARRNPDKLTGPLSRRKVPFQDQGSPTIARGPTYSHLHYYVIA